MDIMNSTHAENRFLGKSVTGYVISINFFVIFTNLKYLYISRNITLKQIFRQMLYDLGG